MKKIIAMLLCLALALGCAVSFAEESGKTTLGTISINGAFTLQCGLPEGYRIQVLKMNRDQIVAMMNSGDDQAPVMQLSVAFDEAYADVDRMNDLGQEDFDLLEKSFTDVDPTVEITYGDTGLGTRLLIARQSASETYNYIAFLSVYKGYLVEFVMVPSQKAESKILTEEQLEMCIDFLTDLDFIPTADLDLAVAVGANDLADTNWLAELSDYDAETNTMQVELMRGVELEPEEVTALKVGDTLAYGDETVVINTLQASEYGDFVINEEIELRNLGGMYHIYTYDKEYVETYATLRLEVPETLTFIDEIDPATGEILDTLTEQSAADFIALLTAGGYPDFASDNVNVTFDANGELSLIQRFYTPWQ